jgi:alpha-L-fucosidase 2
MSNRLQRMKFERPGSGTLLLGMLATGLIVRLAAVMLFHPPLFSDDLDYVALGNSIAHGNGYQIDGHPTAYRPPGYPLLLAFSFRLFGESLVPVRVGQAFADLLSCFLVYALGRRLFTERAGLIGCAIFALFPVQILYVPIMMTETVFTTLLLLYLLLCTGEKASWKMSIVAGVVLGAATLVRPTVLLLPAAVFAVQWKRVRTPAESLRALVLTGAGILIVVFPWLVRNYDEFGRMALTSNTGVNFWMGTHSGASGSYSFPNGNPLLTATDEFDQSDLGVRLGIAFIQKHPIEYGSLLAKKWAHFFSVDYWLLLSMHYQPDFRAAPNAGVVFGKFPLADVLALHLPFAAVLLAATFGLCCHAHDDRRGILFLFAPCAYWILVHLLFYAAARYRFPVVPLFMIGAAYGADILIQKTYILTRLRIVTFCFLTVLFIAGWTAERVVIQRESGTFAHSGVADQGHDIESTQLATSWDEGIPLGNGTLGALVWQQGNALRLSLDRADLWDQRPMKGLDRKEFSYRWICDQVKKNEYALVQRYFDAPYEKEPAPTKIPGAAMTFDIRSLGPVRSVHLSLDSALCVIRWEKGTVLRTFVHASRSSGWFLWGHVPGDVPVRLLPPPYAGNGDTSAQGSVAGDNLVRLGYREGNVESTGSTLTYRQEGWGGFAYEVCVTWKRADGETIEGTWSISSHRKGEKECASASALCRETLGRGFAADLGTHVEWWKHFWSESGLHVPDPVIEKQWYQEQYKFGSASRRGAPPISLQAVWTADNGRIPPWKGDYHHDLNTEMSYWPCYAGNHMDEGLAFLDQLDANRSVYQKYTRQFFGVEGLAVPGVTTLDGAPMGGWIQYAGSPTISSWLAHHFYSHWRYSMDSVFLRTRGYPWLKETAMFLERLTVKDGSGLRNLPLSSSPEIRDNDISAWFTRTTNYDLALMKFVFTAAAEMAEALGLADESAHWKTVAGEFPAFALSGKNELMFAPTLPYNESHRHFSNAMAIHPLGLIRWEDGARSQETIRNTLARFDSIGPGAWCGYSYAWLASLKARGKDGDGAARALSIFARAFCSANSFHVNGDQTKSGYSGFTYRPFTLEGNFAFASGLQEMLLQSYAGFIEVFPAVPESWKDVSFTTFRTEGAFIVSARKEGGIVREVRVESEMGGEANLRNPFRTWYTVSRHDADVRTEGSFLLIKCRPGGEIVLQEGNA